MDIQSVTNSAALSQLLVGTPAVSGAGLQSSGQAAAQSAVATQVAAASATSVTSEQAQQAVDVVNKVVQIFNSDVEFAVDKQTGINLVKVIDKDTDEVIRQLPIEAVVDFARTLDSLQGLLVKQKV